MKRYSELHGVTEIKTLTEGMDFRLPQHRRELFLRFYKFHLKYKSLPGGVYYLIPHLTRDLSFNDRLWFCFLNGCTQNPCTTYVIFKQFPSFENLNMEEFNQWHIANWRRLQYDTDRRYQKGHLVEMVQNYIQVLEGKTQAEYFNDLCYGTPARNFCNVWDEVINKFFMFGRLSTFSYLEYLKIAGVDIECNSLFIYDKSGSKSHRNGLCKVLGRDDMDWHKSNPDFKPYSKEEYQWLEAQGAELLADASERFKDEPFGKLVSYFTLESCLCTFKSMFRVNRRYPNVYNDMLYERIRKAEKEWKGEVDFFTFWDARAIYLPAPLRCEDYTPVQHGVCKIKQNWFRETGQVVVLDIDDETFKNDLQNNNFFTPIKNNNNDDEYSLDLR